MGFVGVVSIKLGCFVIRIFYGLFKANVQNVKF